VIQMLVMKTLPLGCRDQVEKNVQQHCQVL